MVHAWVCVRYVCEFARWACVNTCIYRMYMCSCMCMSVERFENACARFFRRMVHELNYNSTVRRNSMLNCSTEKKKERKEKKKTRNNDFCFCAEKTITITVHRVEASNTRKRNFRHRNPTVIGDSRVKKMRHVHKPGYVALTFLVTFIFPPFFRSSSTYFLRITITRVYYT